MRRFLGFVCFSLISTAASAALAQAPGLDVNCNGQIIGSLPISSIGDAVPAGGVTVADGQPGMVQETIRFFQGTSTLPRLDCTFAGANLTAGQRRISFKLNYDSAGNGTGTPEQFEIQLQDSSLKTIYKLRIAGNTAAGAQPGKLLINGTQPSPAIDVALGQAHDVVIDIDATAKTCSTTIDGGTPTTALAWTNSATDFAVIEFLLTSRQDNPGSNVNSGMVHLDQILGIDPNTPAQEWMTAASGDWDTGANWATNVSPTAGPVLIRAIGADYTVTGSASALSIDALIMSNNGGTAALTLQQNLTAPSLNVSTGARINVANRILAFTSDFVLNGHIDLGGGKVAGGRFSNNSMLSGNGEILATLASNQPGATVRASGGALRFSMPGTIANTGTFDCNGQRIELGADVELSQEGAGTLSLNGGALSSLKQFDATGTGRIDGPGTLELAGKFTSRLAASQMSLGAVNITLIGDATLEALTEDQGKHGHSLAGLNNALQTLTVGAHKLTLDKGAAGNDNDPSTIGINNETALYVTNLNLSGTTQDVVGGKVYYQNLVGGTDSFANFVGINNDAPDGMIVLPAQNITVNAGDSVSFSASATDPDGLTSAITYAWNFGDGRSSTQQNPGNIAFPNVGTFNVSMTATDGEGLADTTPATRVITVVQPVNAAPTGVIDSPSGNVTIGVGQTVTFGATVGDPDNTPGTRSHLWTFSLGSGLPEVRVEDPGPLFFNYAGTFTVTYTVTDGGGVSDGTPDTRIITVNPVTVGPVPGGPGTTPEPGQPGVTPTPPALNPCGVCGAASPAFSIVFVAGYCGLLIKRKRRYVRRVK